MTSLVSILPASEAAPPVPALSELGRHQRRAGLLLAAPATILLVSLSLGPAALVVLLSFTDYRLGKGAVDFIGLANYAELLSEKDFLRSVRNTAVYVAIVVPGSVLIGLCVALLIASRRRLVNFYKVAYFLPVTATLVAMATAWEVVLHPSFGFINLALTSLGLERLGFLNDPDSALFTLAMIGIWDLIGFNMVLFLAGLATIPKELYEAAAIDGAESGTARFLLVTWPMLGPVTMFVVIMTAIRAFRVFETVAVLTQGGPVNSTNVLLYTLFEEAFRFFRIGYASAIAVVFLTFIAILIILQARFFDRRISYER